MITSPAPMQTPMVKPALPPDMADADLRRALDRINWLCTPPWERYFLALGGGSRVLQGTHDDRAGFPAGSAALGQLFYETDRTTLYLVSEVDGEQAWVPIAGEMNDLLANLPTDLEATDAGFRILVSNYARRFTWNGTHWQPADDCRTEVRMPITFPYTHTIVVDTDETTVTWVSGPKFDSKWGTNNRIQINGTFYAVASFTSDTELELTATAGVQSDVTMLTAVGWHYLDGKGDANGAGGNVSILLPNATATNIQPEAIASLFPKFSGTGPADVDTAAAVFPTITGSTQNTGAHTHEIPSHDHGGSTGSASDGTTTVMAGVGSDVASGGGHTHSISSHGPDTAVSNGNHSHTAGTLANITALEPANFGVGAWLKK